MQARVQLAPKPGEKPSQRGPSRRLPSSAARDFASPRRRAVHAAAVLCAALALSGSGEAHIDLSSPPPRQPGRPDSTLRRAPCGQRQTARTDVVSVFRPGETIDVIADVYVQHVSYFRVALDLDGDDSFSMRRSAPDDPSADDLGALPAGDGELILDYVLNDTGDLERVERQITLPNQTCERCTLQLIQFTYGLPVDEAVYYQCADLTIAGEPVPGAVDEEPHVAEVPPGSSDPDRASGCSLASGGHGHEAAGATFAALLLGLAARRRQRSGRESIQAPSSST